jgi:NAD(P)-dependent dehydrogenase (short-subunit alcohol dehydrogenase family)
MSSFADKVIVVTGAGSGIGAATAITLAHRGAAVVAADRNLAGAASTVEEIRFAGGRAAAVEADVTRPGDAVRIVDLAVSEFGGLHGAVNNAGHPSSGTPLAEESIELWDRVIAVNLSGIFFGLRAQIPAILASGGGAIVNVSSVMGGVAARGSSAYTAAKHGVVGLSKVAALDYSAQGVRVNAVGPGYVETPMVEGRFSSAEELAAKQAQHPIGRLGQAVEVAHLVVFLLSDEASFITGAFYPVDGGYSAQ